MPERLEVHMLMSPLGRDTL